MGAFDKNGDRNREEAAYSGCSRIRTKNTAKYYDIRSKIESSC